MITLHAPSLSRISISRFNALIYTPQNSRWWLFWHGMALRLAWNVTPKHTSFADAVWSWRKAWMGRETSCSSQKNEEKMGGRLGWMSEAQGTWGAFCSVNFVFAVERLILKPRVRSSRYAQYPLTQILFLYTTSFFSQIQKNSTLFLNPWKAIYIISLKLAKDVHSQEVFSLPSSVKSYQVWITFMQMATFIGILNQRMSWSQQLAFLITLLYHQ